MLPQHAVPWPLLMLSRLPASPLASHLPPCLPACRYSSGDLVGTDSTNQEFAVASWNGKEEPSVQFASNSTTKLAITLISPTRASLRLEYVDKFTAARVVRTFPHVLPRGQDRVCIGVINYVMETMAADADMTAELTIINNSGKRVWLRLLGFPSLTARPAKPTAASGQVTVKGRSGTVLASRAAGVAWQNAENLVILPDEGEWGAITP